MTREQPPPALINDDERFERTYSKTRGQCLRSLRHQEGWTLREAAAKVPMSYGHLHALEHDQHRISLDHAVALMKLYGGSIRIFAQLPGK